MSVLFIFTILFFDLQKFLHLIFIQWNNEKDDEDDDEEEDIASMPLKKLRWLHNHRKSVAVISQLSNIPMNQKWDSSKKFLHNDTNSSLISRATLISHNPRPISAKLNKKIAMFRRQMNGRKP